MGFNTKTNFTTQVKQYSGTTALLSGSTQMLEGLTANTLTTLDGMAYYTGSNTDISDIDSAIPKVLVTKEWVENEISIVYSADTFISAITFDNMSYDLTLHRNDGTDLSESLAVLASDIYVTSGAYDPNTGNVVFTNNSGNTFNVSGFTTGMTNYYTTAVTLTNETLYFDRNDSLSAYTINLGALVSGSTFSATTPYEFTTGSTDGSIQPIYSASRGNSNTSDWATIAGGTGNTLTKSGNFSFIGAGSNNYLSGSDYSAIVTGKNNTLLTPNLPSQGGYNFISGGLNNSITGRTTHNSILGGVGNRVRVYSYRSVILGGSGNTHHYSSNSIIGGSNNTIYGGAFNSNGGTSGLMVGANNYSEYSYKFLTWGGSNIISNSNYSIIGGSGNTMYGNTNFSNRSFNSIINGKGNIISVNEAEMLLESNDGNFNFIGNGHNNKILKTPLLLPTLNSILNGYNNLIQPSPYNIYNTHIIGSQITATTSNTTFVNNLNLYDTPTTGVTENILVRESDGSVKIRTLSDLIDGSSLSASTPFEFTTGTTTGSIRPTYGESKGTSVTIPWSTIAGGTGNTMDKGGTINFIGGGADNVIQGSSYSNILSGKGNLVATQNVITKFNNILGGLNNKITGSTQWDYNNTIINGTNGYIGGYHNTIGGGKLNRIENSYNNTIVGGSGNTITYYSNYNSIGQGKGNLTISGRRSNIGNGNTNKIHYGYTSSILNGINNDIYTNIRTNLEFGPYVLKIATSTITNGVSNSISGSSQSIISQGYNNTIIGKRTGYNNVSTYNTIHNGKQNTILSLSSDGIPLYNGHFSTIDNGNYNGIITYLGDSKSNTINNGLWNIISHPQYQIGSTSFNSINNGSYNIITGGTNYSTIINGINNRINNSSVYSTILNGSNNLISGRTNTHIIGSNITATTDNTTFLNKLNLYDSPSTGNSVSEILVRDTDGSVKVRNASTISSVSPFSTGTTTTSIYPTASVGNSVTALNSTIAGGSGNTISTPLSFIGSGNDNVITINSNINGYGKNNLINGGYNNTISGGTLSGSSKFLLNTIGGGRNNYIKNISGDGRWTVANTIGNGNFNKMILSGYYNIIGNGNNNEISGVTTVYNNIIGTGSGNKIHGNYGIYNNTVGNGNFNKISGGNNIYRNTISNGVSNTISGDTNLRYNNINGTNNTIIGYSYLYNNQIHGNRNNIIGSSNWYSTILNGGQNNITGSNYYSTILGGRFNTINDSNYVSIFGRSNLISGLTNTHIIGSNITALTSNFTYVNNLNLYDTPTTGSTTGDTVNNILYRNSNGDVRMVDISTAFNREISLALSDEVTDLVTGTTVVTRRSPYNLELTTARIEVNTPPSGASVTVDVKVNGVSIFSTLISIDSGEETSVTSATPYVITGSTINYNDKITADITTIGTTTAGKGLKMDLFGTLF